MHVSYSDESAFHAANPLRRTSDEVDLGATWRAEGSDTAWRLAWLRETGEVYLCRASSLPGAADEVTVLAIVTDEHALDVAVAGWRDHQGDENSLGWLTSRLSPVAA